MTKFVNLVAALLLAATPCRGYGSVVPVYQYDPAE